MKKTFKILALTLAVLTVLSISACGKNAKQSTLIFGETDLSEYVTLGKYKSLSVDTASEEYKSEYSAVLKSDVERNDLYVKKQEGKVAEGDVANIDYVGKKDGVAFEGGTAQGYDLEIGSHSFIDGFEDGLIGANIGDTVDLNLTFPENYGSSELAGAAVVFTVKVNYVKSSDVPGIDGIYSKLGFDSEKDYEADIKKRAVQSILINKVMENSEVESIPDKDKDIYVNAVYKYWDNYYNSNYNTSFEDVLKSNNMTADDYKSQMSSAVETQISQTVVSYAILQKEGLKAEYVLKENETVNVPVLDETIKVEHTVKDFLYKNAKIK